MKQYESQPEEWEHIFGFENYLDFFIKITRVFISLNKRIKLQRQTYTRMIEYLATTGIKAH